eukprot:scaffold175070_cov30-Tisochrysis_lutea.AAC.1
MESFTRGSGVGGYAAKRCTPKMLSMRSVRGKMKAQQSHPFLTAALRSSPCSSQPLHTPPPFLSARQPWQRLQLPAAAEYPDQRVGSHAWVQCRSKRARNARPCPRSLTPSSRRELVGGPCCCWRGGARGRAT